MENVKYIDNNSIKGIQYDFTKILKEYKKLKIPLEVWTPQHLPFNKAHTFIELSERSIGKTTNIILFGMIMNKIYGTIIHYVRDNALMLENRNIKELFDVIKDKQYKYIEKITEGEYNSVLYKAKRWYYCYINENGEIEKTAQNHFMMCLSTDKSEAYKSIYVCAKGDLIIYDEFIHKFYNERDFFNFYDLHKTISRQRESVITFFLSNTIDINSPWFEEMEISENIVYMEIGQKEIFTTNGGTNIFVELIEPSKIKRKGNIVLNKLYYGFKNPLLYSITGAQTWAVKEYQKIPNNTNLEKVVIGNLYIEYYGKLVRCRIIKTNNLGVICYCSKATKFYKDSIILTNNFISDRQHFYGIKSIPNLKEMYEQHKFYYATNSVGAIIENFMKVVI